MSKRRNAPPSPNKINKNNNQDETLELMIDLEDKHINDPGFFYLHPKYVSKMNCLKDALFTACRINNTPVEELSLNTLQLIYNTLKQGGMLEIFITQPLSVMVDYDLRQIVANLNLIGFNILEPKDIKGQNKNFDPHVLAQKPNKQGEEKEKEKVNEKEPEVKENTKSAKKKNK